MKLEPGKVIRVEQANGTWRVWRVAAVLLGGENQENVVELETMDLKESAHSPLFVPLALIESGAEEV